MTLFKTVNGRDPPTFLKLQDELSLVEEGNKQIRSRNLIIATLKGHLQKVREEMKRQADKHRRDVCFEIGDLVYVKIQPYRLRTVARRINEKLSPRFYGPFKVLERVDAMAYKLDLPPTAQVHPVFHLSNLKKSIQSAQVTPTIPPALSEQFELQVQPKDVIQVRQLTNGWLEVLIMWQDLQDFDNSLELVDVMARQFPDFHLKDKVKLLGEGNITTPFKGQAYKKRQRKLHANG